MPQGISHRQRNRTLAYIDRNDDRGRRDWGSTHRHNTPPVSVRRNRRINARSPKDPYGSLLTPPEVLGKTYLDLYQRTSLKVTSLDQGVLRSSHRHPHRHNALTPKDRRSDLAAPLRITCLVAVLSGAAILITRPADAA